MMTVTADINNLINQQSRTNKAIVSDQMICDAIVTNYALHQKVLNNYNRYNGYVPILDRKQINPNKLNNLLSNDFRGEIIDCIKGYLFGSPISYQISEQNYESDRDKEGKAVEGTNLYKAKEALKRFLTKNHIADADSDAGGMQAIAGYAARLVYLDKTAEVRCLNVNPWEVIIIKDATLDVTTLAIIYYPINIMLNGQVTQKTRVEVYDQTNVSYYVGQLNTLNNANILPDYQLQNQITFSNFELDPEMENPVQPHYCGRVPVIEFQNNRGRKGDFEKVESLIDAYDRTMSDIQNEIEEFRLAYMKFTGGVELKAETITAARLSGGISLPEGADVSFITKDVNSNFIENHLKQLQDNILKYSKTVDMSDDKFSGGNQSGESRKWKLLSLENKAITKERKFTRGLYEMFECICNLWRIKGVCTIEPEDVLIKWTRNLPMELKTNVEAAKNMAGVFPDNLIYSLMPFIGDVDEVIEQMKNQKDESGSSLYMTDVPDTKDAKDKQGTQDVSIGDNKQ